MRTRFARVLLIGGTFALSLICVTLLGWAQEATPQAPGNPPQAGNPGGPKMAEEVYKNIKVLKGIPADQVIPAMQFMSASLGVDCDFCHEGRAFEKDTKDEKETARKMIEMQYAIDKTYFHGSGHSEMTCNACHRGAVDPVRTPTIPEEAPKVAAQLPPAPAADEVLTRYVQTIGGPEALEKITSLVEKGTLSHEDGTSSSIEVYLKAPDKAVIIVQTSKGPQIQSYDGKEGWLARPGRPTRPLRNSEFEPLKFQADPEYLQHLKLMFPRVTVRRVKVEEQELVAVVGMRPGRPPVQIGFDPATGLIQRTMFFFDSPLGNNPMRTEYSDFRAVNGVKVPYRLKVAQPDDRYTVQFDTIQANVPIDDQKFGKPEPKAASIAVPSPVS